MGAPRCLIPSGTCALGRYHNEPATCFMLWGTDPFSFLHPPPCLCSQGLQLPGLLLIKRLKTQLRLVPTPPPTPLVVVVVELRGPNLNSLSAENIPGTGPKAGLAFLSSSGYSSPYASFLISTV